MTTETEGNPVRPTEAKHARKLLVWGLSITAIYCVLLITYGLWLGPKLWAMLQGEPDKFATFLAGVLSPLGFFWLVLGFKQQGDELQNSARALWLQGEELRNSVEQQRQLVEVAREQMATDISARREQEAADEEAAQPKLALKAAMISPMNKAVHVQVTVQCLGPSCTALRCFVDGNLLRFQSFKYYKLFPEGGWFYLSLPNPGADDLAAKTVTLEYTDGRGNRRAQVFEFSRQRDDQPCPIRNPSTWACNA